MAIKIKPVANVEELRAKMLALVTKGSDDELILFASQRDLGAMVIEGVRQSVDMGPNKCDGPDCDSDHYNTLGMFTTFGDPDGTMGEDTVLGKAVGGVGHVSINVTPFSDAGAGRMMAEMAGVEDGNTTIQ